MEYAKQIMHDRFFFDLRNIYKRHDVEEAGFDYYGVGQQIDPLLQGLVVDCRIDDLRNALTV